MSDVLAAASEAGVLITAIIALVVIVWLLSRDQTQPPHQ